MILLFEVSMNPRGAGIPTLGNVEVGLLAERLNDLSGNLIYQIVVGKLAEGKEARLVVEICHGVLR